MRSSSRTILLHRWRDEPARSNAAITCGCRSIGAVMDVLTSISTASDPTSSMRRSRGQGQSQKQVARSLRAAILRDGRFRRPPQDEGLFAANLDPGAERRTCDASRTMKPETNVLSQKLHVIGPAPNGERLQCRTARALSPAPPSPHGSPAIPSVASAASAGWRCRARPVRP